MYSRIAIILLAASTTALADEGLWTFDNFPAARVESTYGVEVSQEWLDRVRSAAVRLSNCTASFVSPDGLILTNHHCVESCLAELSSREASLLEDGFIAGSRAGERRCTTQVADVLVEMQDVTAEVGKATQGLADLAANEARKQALTKLEQSCEQASARDRRTGPLKCEAVTLYQGGQYFLYKYRRYDDVRIVLAPERDIAAFGGDPDNFQFPRWSLDFSLLRAYVDGKPAKTPSHLTIDFAGPDAGELVFVAGHPGSTSRLLTSDQLRFERDVSIPMWLLRASELRGRYLQFATSSPEAARIVESPLNSLENGIKVQRKRLDALHEDDELARKAAEEAALKARYRGPGDPWAEIAKASARERELFLEYLFLENSVGLNSAEYRYARSLVRVAAERGKPNAERLREYSEGALPRLEQQLSAPVPVYPELENLTLSYSLERMREWLGPDHPVVRQLLSKDSPESLAARLVSESKLEDPAVRMRLYEGGAAAVAASDDPMIELARSLDARTRAVRKQYEDEVEAPTTAAAERIAAARFAALGTEVYPDATFTLRLNYGTVQAWNENGVELEPFTRLEKLYTRATGQTPFKVPPKWLAAKDSLDMQTPYCISTTNDIIGGNSGSALIDANGRVVGLIFDGNIHSISGDYWFDTEKNRSIAVHTAIIGTALAKVYGADALMKELGAR